MTKSQTITIRLSECRQKINDLLGVEDRNADQQTELETLTGEIQKLEPELRAAVAAEPDPQARVTDTADPETRARLELRGRVSFGGWLAAQLGAGTDFDHGAFGEYRSALGADLQPGMPIDIFETDRPAPETRATTPAPTTGTGVTLAPVQPFVFAPSIAPRLGIDMPAAPSGSYAEMTISTALTPMAEAKGDPADGTAGALTAVTANPRRISARLSLTLEDIAQVGQANFESALRAHTSMALSNAYDDQCINGNGTAPHVNGLINQLMSPTSPTSVVTFDGFVGAYADAITGLWASMVSEVSMVANVDAYKLSAKTFRDAAGADLGAVSFASYAEQVTGGWWTNKRMPATASTIARAIVYRMGKMGLRTACHPTWGTISIDDIYTNSASGTRHFTIHILVGDRVILVQPDAYDLVEFKVA